MSTLPLFEADHLAMTEAKEAEFVPTPGWVPRVLIEQMAAAGHPALPLSRCIESAFGEGAIVRAINATTPDTRRVWYGTELRSDALARARVGAASISLRRADYLTHGSGITGAGLWITNPPWSLAAAFWAKMLEEAAGIGTVAMHVPWAFAATDALDELAVDLYPIEGRPYPFARETCWIVTGPGRGGRFLRLRKPR